jgi:hypothetical protein
MTEITEAERETLGKLLDELADARDRNPDTMPISARLSFALAHDAVRGIRDAGFWLRKDDDELEG